MADRHGSQGSNIESCSLAYFWPDSFTSPDPPRCEQATLQTPTATGRFLPVLCLNELDPLNYETKQAPLPSSARSAFVMRMGTDFSSCVWHEDLTQWERQPVKFLGAFPDLTSCFGNQSYTSFSSHGPMTATRHLDETLVWGLAIGSPELPSILLTLWAGQAYSPLSLFFVASTLSECIGRPFISVVDPWD